MGYKVRLIRFTQTRQWFRELPSFRAGRLGGVESKIKFDRGRVTQLAHRETTVCVVDHVRREAVLVTV